MNALTFINFIILSLAVWRISKMLTTEKGPYDVIERFRNSIINKPWSPIFCFKCTTIWVSFFLASILGLQIEYFVLAWFASSALAIFMDAWYEARNRYGL